MCQLKKYQIVARNDSDMYVGGQQNVFDITGWNDTCVQIFTFIDYKIIEDSAVLMQQMKYTHFQKLSRRGKC